MRFKMALVLCVVFALGGILGHWEARYFSNPTEQRAGSEANPTRLSQGHSDNRPNGFSPADYLMQGDRSKSDAFKQKATDDPRSAFLSALSQPDDEAKLRLLQSAFVRWTLSAPTQALGNIERIPVNYRQETVNAGLSALAEQQPEKVLSYLNGISDIQTTNLATVLEVVARHDPKQAIDSAYQYQDRDPQGELLSAIIPSLAATHLDMVAEVVTSMGDRAPVALIQQIAAQYAKGNPAQAYAWATEFAQNRPAATADEILNGVSAGFAASNLNEAIDYLGRVSDPQIKNSLIREISNKKGQEDLQSAWNWLDQYRTEGGYNENARNLLDRWSYVKPDEVAHILASVADQELQAASVKQLSSLWQKRDIRAYQAWLAALPPGPMKSAALSASQ